MVDWIVDPLNAATLRVYFLGRLIFFTSQFGAAADAVSPPGKKARLQTLFLYP